MAVDGNTKPEKEDLRALLESAVVLSEDHGGEVEAAVQDAVDRPLDPVRARRLYSKIIELLRANGDATSKELAADVEREAEEIVASVERPAPPSQDGFFVHHNGLKPRKVMPTPGFNGKTVEMEEGYVDVARLKLWKDNERLSLHIQEFVEENAREPDDGELISLMQGAVNLPSFEKKPDAFKLKPLAESIARKGVEVPPIVSYEGEPKDGNRRIAASLLVVHGEGYDSEQRERARFIRVWRAPEGTTEDQFEAIVVSRNFESDYKEPWPEYIKGKLVVEELNERRRRKKGKVTASMVKKLQAEVAKDFAIKPEEVRRYDGMIRWAEDFASYLEEAGEDPAEIRYKTEKNFQWFYEMDAGRGSAKLTRKLDTDDELKAIVYDLMFSVLDAGAQVRNLHKVVADPDSTRVLFRAHELAKDDPAEALELVDEAISEAKRKNVRRRSIGFEAYLKTMVDRLGSTPPDQWNDVDTDLLVEVRRVMVSTLGSIEGQENARGERGEEIER